jgi:uncharacterized cupin superfamily protein
MVESVTVANVETPEWPLEALGAQVTIGSPKASGKITFQTDDKLVTGGVWACSAGEFNLTLGWDEMAYLLEGELIIEEAPGKRVLVHPGDVFFLRKGSETRWIVKKDIKKVFFLRSPEPLG